MTEYNNLDMVYRDAVAAHQAGDLIRATKNYQTVLDENRTHLPSLNNLAAALAALGKNGEAIACYEKGLAQHPDSPELRANFGNLLREFGDLNGAAEQYANCLNQDPSLVEVRYALGVILRSIGRPDDAKNHLRQVTKSLKSDPRPWTALSAIALDASQHDEAETAVGEALAISPDNADANNMEGLIAKAKGNFTRSRKAFERAIAAEPEHAEARFNRGTILLLTGEMPTGWADFESRWKNRTPMVGAPSQLPKWEGENINGKSILVLGEQGFGDTIQFIRYAPCLQKLGARVTVQCREPLLRLMASAPGVDNVGNLGDTVSENLWVPIMSLPNIFCTTEATIPGANGYLKRPTPKKTGDKPHNIGLVWAGSPSHKNDSNRSIKLDDFSPLLELDDYDFFSLQMGERRKDLNHLQKQHRIPDIMAEVKDFKDTVERLSKIDLLITVDTAIAHLAGAVGCKTFLLLPKVPDWRWMLDRQDTPWYRSIKIFRQGEAKNWRDPINAIRYLLEN